jgi:hypothetical protein
MGLRLLYGAGKALSYVLVLASACLAGWVVFAWSGWTGGQSTPLLYAVFYVAWIGGNAVSVLVHEGGHALACRAFRVKILGFHVGKTGKAAFRFRVRDTRVTLGWAYGGRVEHGPVKSRQKNTVIRLAGPLATIIPAGVMVAVGFGLLQPGLARAILISVAGVFGLRGIGNLMPYRTREGRLTDGAALLSMGKGRLARAIRRDYGAFRTPDGVTWRPYSPKEAAEYKADVEAIRKFYEDQNTPLPAEMVTRLLAAFRKHSFAGLTFIHAIGRTLRLEGRIDELLALHEGYPVLPVRRDPMMRQMLIQMQGLSYEVALVPEVPQDVLALASQRIERVLRDCDSDEVLNRAVHAGTLHSLAVVRLRQGRFGEVEWLFGPETADPSLPPEHRASVLAVVVLARRALGQPYEDMLAEAVALCPAADLVTEAAADSPAPPALLAPAESQLLRTKGALRNSQVSWTP